MSVKRGAGRSGQVVGLQEVTGDGDRVLLVDLHLGERLGEVLGGQRLGERVERLRSTSGVTLSDWISGTMFCEV